MMCLSFKEMYWCFSMGVCRMSSNRLWLEKSSERRRKRRRGSSRWRWWMAWSVELIGTQGKAVGCRGAEGWVTGKAAAGWWDKVEHWRQKNWNDVRSLVKICREKQEKTLKDINTSRGHVPRSTEDIILWLIDWLIDWSAAGVCVCEWLWCEEKLPSLSVHLWKHNKQESQEHYSTNPQQKKGYVTNSYRLMPHFQELEPD